MQTPVAAASRLTIRAWAAPILVDMAHHGLGDLRNTVMAVLAVLTLAYPVPASLCALAVADLGFGVSVTEHFTRWRVHRYVGFMVHGTVVLAFFAHLVARRRWLTGADFFQLMRWPARLFAAAMFFAGFVKLNSDFLDPRVSCGTIYYLWFTTWPLVGGLLPTGERVATVIIYTTVVFEILGPILILFRPTRAVGLAMVWLIVASLALLPRALYFEFAGLFWACSLYWVDTQVLAGAAARLGVARGPGGSPGRRWLTPMVAAALFGMVYFTPAIDPRTPAAFGWRLLAFAVVCSVSLAIALAWRRPAPESHRSSAAPGAWALAGPLSLLVWLGPAALYANEFSVYLGLFHRPALKMASNSLMARNDTNHLVFKRLPLPAATTHVTILESNLRSLGRGRHCSMLVLRHHLVGHPEAQLVYRRPDGAIERVESPEAVAALASPSLLVEHLRLGAYRASGKRYICDKSQPGLSRAETYRRVLKRLRQDGDDEFRR